MKPISHKDLAPLEVLFDATYPPTLRDLATSLFMQLLETFAALAPDPLRGAALARLALEQADRISIDHGGCNLYIPMATSFKLTPRNIKMCQEFRGDYKALARKYKMSEQQVRNIVDSWQRDQFLKRQGRLPGLDDT